VKYITNLFKPNANQSISHYIKFTDTDLQIDPSYLKANDCNKDSIKFVLDHKLYNLDEIQNKFVSELEKCQINSESNMKNNGINNKYRN